VDADTLRIVLPAVTALIGAALGALAGPLIARKSSLDTARVNLEGQRQLAREAEERAELASERERRRALVELTREHVREVETFLITSAANPPKSKSLLTEDVRWEAIPSEAFESALGRYRWAKSNMSMALLDVDQTWSAQAKFDHLREPISLLKTAVLDQHSAAALYIRNGPDRAEGVSPAALPSPQSAPATTR
jgi:hypothetical protein